MHNQKPGWYVAVVISLVTYFFLGYRAERTETTSLLLCYGILFGVYTWVILKSHQKEVLFWLAMAIIFRLILLPSVPTLSDDVYRFIWDGRLMASGVHPFAELPGYYIQNNLNLPGVNQALFDKLNSPEYFTIYPPFSQFIFWLSVKLFPSSILGSIVVMRSLILAAEIGSLFLLLLLLRKFNLPEQNVLLYALNPLVIIELSWNLHFEAFVIFFLLLSLYLLAGNRIWKAAISFSVAIGTKLLPLIFLPLLLARIGWRRSIVFYFIAGTCCLVLLTPLWNVEIITGFNESISLYFKKFEFNASLYYLVREYGYWQKGYNIIQTVGWKLGLAAGIFIIILAVAPFFMNQSYFHESNKNPLAAAHVLCLPGVMMWSLLIYFLFTTTLHPWYITTLLALSAFTRFRFVVFWTALIFLTYSGYSESGFKENLLITAIEYILVFGYLVYELVWKKERQFSL